MEINVKQELKTVKLVHFALIAGVLLFLIFAIFINQFQGPFIGEDEELMLILLIAANVLTISSIVGGQFVFKKRINDIETYDLPVKLKKYRDVMIVRSATLEAPAFFFIVCYLLFGTSIFLFEALACFILLTVFFPSNFRIAKEIKHDLRELESINS